MILGVLGDLRHCRCACSSTMGRRYQSEVARHDSDPAGLIGDHQVEGLIVSGRALLRVVGGASQGGV